MVIATGPLTLVIDVSSLAAFSVASAPGVLVALSCSVCSGLIRASVSVRLMIEADALAEPLEQFAMEERVH
jgi:hypothetical protein